jgi:hypothetical protein
MADSTTNLDSILSTQAAKEAVANALIDAASPATMFGRRASTSSGLTWGYYGGKLNISGTITNFANGTLSLTASTTCYIEVDTSTGTVSFNTSAFSGGTKVPLYKVVTGSTTVTSWTDERPSAIQPPTSGMTNPMTTAGDIIIGGTAGAPARLGIGTSTYVLTVVAGAPAWAAAPGGSNAGVPVNTQTGTSYHPVLADAPQSACYQGTVTMNNASANTVTIDQQSTTAWVAGTVLNAIQLGAGQTSFVAGSGVTIRNASSLNCRAQYSMISAYRIASDSWIVFGDMA